MQLHPLKSKSICQRGPEIDCLWRLTCVRCCLFYNLNTIPSVFAKTQLVFSSAELRL
jgi:hypothetical protein